MPDAGGPGDVILIRTGWRHYLDVDPAMYLSTNVPGLGLREIRFLASRRPAILGMDVWFFGARGQDDPSAAILGHQEAAIRYGVRIGEAVPTDVLADDGVFEFVFILSPNNARGRGVGQHAAARAGPAAPLRGRAQRRRVGSVVIVAISAATATNSDYALVVGTEARCAERQQRRRAPSTA